VNGNEVVSQRFAIDWIQVDRKHRAWVGDPARLSSYRNYGKPLIASARGKVIVARDRFPNQPPPNNPIPPSVPDLPGNVVVLRVGPGIYLTYAHMVPGSVRVHIGERVRRGQVLGRLGNSGNSATPHLHFQVQITRSFLGDGLPFVFRSFRFLGRITEPVSDENLGLRPNGKLPFARASRPGPRHGEMPLDLDVVRFPRR
jgi:murein DD-endopeptidase MepM/ murein hydrolase activator NlpD